LPVASSSRKRRTTLGARAVHRSSASRQYRSAVSLSALSPPKSPGDITVKIRKIFCEISRFTTGPINRWPEWTVGTGNGKEGRTSKPTWIRSISCPGGRRQSSPAQARLAASIRIRWGRVGGRLTGGGRRAGRECRSSYRARPSKRLRQAMMRRSAAETGLADYAAARARGRSPSSVPSLSTAARFVGHLIDSQRRALMPAELGVRQRSGSSVPAARGPGSPSTSAIVRLFPCAVAAAEGEGEGGAERATAPGALIEHVGSGCAVAGWRD
jgi:hypothetical protein